MNKLENYVWASFFYISDMKEKNSFFFLPLKNIFLLFCLYFTAPPELSTERQWIHASEGCEIEIVCTLQSDMNTDVIIS